MQVLTNQLGTLNQVKGFAWVDPNLVLGVLLVIFVLLVPRGLTGLASDAWRRLVGLVQRPQPAAQPVQERISNPRMGNP
jgi:branched-chain amino acid transport system permease protein